MNNVDNNTSEGKPNYPKEEDEEDDDEEEDEGTEHDTITSLAGEKMLRKFKLQIHRSSNGSLSSLRHSNFDDVLKEEPLLEEEDNDVFIETEEHIEDVFVPPDGGYGWFVCLGTFISMFWSAGLVKSYGVIFAELITLYPERISLAAWIPATMTTIGLAMAPVTSVLCQKYNTRYVTAVGAAVTSAGIAASSVMPSLETIFITLGVVTGFGMGLSTTPGVILTARYFNKRRSMANAFCLSGTAAGSFVIPILMGFLLKEYGFRGTLLILGGCTLNIFVSAALFRPLALYVRIEKAQAMRREKEIIRQLDDGKNKERLLDEDEIEEDNGVHDTITELAGVHILKQFNRQMTKGRPEAEDCRMIYPERKEAFPNHMERSVPSQSICLTDRSSQRKPIQNPTDYSSSLPKSNGLQIHTDYSSSLPPDTSMLSPLTPNLGKTPFSLQGSFDSICSEFPNTTDVSSTNLSKKNGNFNPRFQQSTNSTLSLNVLKKNRNHSENISHSGHNLEANVANLRRNWSSTMFSCEDLFVDSTSILKDTRHPSHIHLQGGQIHRQVNQHRRTSSTKSLHIPNIKRAVMRSKVERSQTTAGAKSSYKRKARTRHFSDSQTGRPNLSRTASCASRTTIDSRCSDGHSHDRLSLIGSTEMLDKKSSEMVASDLTEAQRGKFTIAPVKTTPEIGCNDKANKTVIEVKKKDNKLFDFSLCKNPIFLLIGSSVMSMAVGVPHCLFFLPPYVTSLGFSKSQSGYLLSICAVFDLLGRIIPGIFLDRNIVPKYTIYVLNMMMAGVACLILPIMSTYSGISVCMAFYGFGIGGWFLMVPVLLADYLGVENIATSYGLARLFQAVGNLGGPMISGHLMATSGVQYSFYFMGSIMTLGSFLFLTQPVIAKRAELVNRQT